MKSLRIRIFASIAGIIVVFAAAVMLLNWCCLTTFYFQHGNSMLKSAVSQIRASFPEEMSYDTDAFASIEDTNDIDIIIYKSDGEAVYATILREFDPEVNDANWLRYRLEEIMRLDIVESEYDSGESRFEIQKSKDGAATYIAYRAHIKDDYWSVVRMNANVLKNSASVANTFMGMTVVIMLFVAVAASALIAGHLSKPIRQMNAVTRAMSKFDFSQKVTVTGRDEIAQLAMSINILSENTSRLLDELNEKNAKLEKEVEHERALEKMRKEFVSNVSHELKTPIAIIQGYAEGLRLNVAGDEKRRDVYCGIIESESYKMDKLVKQLLELSRLESGQSAITKNAFNLTDMTGEVVKRIASITDDIEISCLFDDSPRIAYADEMRMEQVLTNYLNNAISHCKYGMRIDVDITEKEYGWRVSVYNTGDHIPDDIAENIWLSFYRADKSRSRENGNCGLGLSIVSTIMKQHGREYGFDNVDGGVSFWFDVARCEEGDLPSEDGAEPCGDASE